ncbi:2-(3-amino-3-carboxypropyl)histidine synthase subunit 2-like [Dendronephthya gigantea]|uniref:2-(3-amino-3-carboxypropyl)histidine synthase subunit 2-like n=1 Tax=Dendronephthya gigantea TaxID=151771 RepID=UPI0010692DC1|nr:2-(3-amino-3-carboxypropyl)histidine synthase subunit 2-like [Dendronephthya gigantea]
MDTIIPSSKFNSDVHEDQFSLASETATKYSLEESHLEEFYNLENCVQRIKNCGIRTPKVALQFPDSLLCQSSQVAQIIEEKVDCRTYILADTSYGSCCVDEIAAEHVKADLIIHFGASCLSRTERIPVVFAFGKKKINVEHCCQSFQSCFPDKDCKIILIYDVVYHHSIDSIYSKLSSEYRSLVSTSLVHNDNDDNNSKKTRVGTDKSECRDNENITTCSKNLASENKCKTEDAYCRFGRRFVLENGCRIEDYVVFYIGEESLSLTNHMMAYNTCQFYSYNPESSRCRKETLSVNRLLMKRYYLIERAKDARVVGILIGTLGVANYLTILQRIKKILRQCGKKCFTFVTGKLSPEKLANFMEIDVFVLIACPENSIICSQEFYRPIITPFEIEIACTRARDWTGEYITDFHELLPGSAKHVEIESKGTEEVTDEVPDVSLISGKLRPVFTQQEIGKNRSDSLVLKNQNTTLSTQPTSAAGFLAQRSWKGLEPKRGETEVTKAVEGRSGIASGYANEPFNTSS